MIRKVLLMVALAAGPARAQTPDAPPLLVPDENAWSFSVAASAYALSEDRHYLQPTVIADKRWLHLEARSNYEDLDTGSAWMGVNFSGGKALEWELTPMVGGVFGNTDGFAPGLKASLNWRKLQLYSEGEYVVDANDRDDSFFYNWSEVSLAPVEWFRFGLVTQRSRVYQSEREIQRGVITGFSFKRVGITGYVFNPDKDTRFVLAAELRF